MHVRSALRLLCGILLSALTATTASAQQEMPQSIPFSGGAFKIEQNEDFERVLSFDGKEIARGFLLFFERSAEIGDTNIALFSVGDGGNACGAATLIASKRADTPLRTDMVGEDCGAPPASLSDSAIYFVPYLLPGETSAVQRWTPDHGLRTAGDLTFTPQPGTEWSSLANDIPEYMVDVFDNAAAYEAAKSMLGDDLTGVVTGLLTGGNVEKQPDGLLTASGCVPHACGISDSFVAVDVQGQKLYFAQQNDGGEPKAWPALTEWPETVRNLMAAAILSKG